MLYPFGDLASEQQPGRRAASPKQLDNPELCSGGGVGDDDSWTSPTIISGDPKVLLPIAFSSRLVCQP